MSQWFTNLDPKQIQTWHFSTRFLTKAMRDLIEETGGSLKQVGSETFVTWGPTVTYDTDNNTYVFHLGEADLTYLRDPEGLTLTPVSN